MKKMIWITKAEALDNYISDGKYSGESIQEGRTMDGTFLILAGGLLVIIAAVVVVSAVTSVISAVVAAEEDEED